ncbi:DUF4132 domain-containing protein [Catenulispora rubra]|uniref:DUF4132 domain-containing protein n=1 Tax=Catenulispora rubra TaxID=280293 RepID=UPI00189206E4|nr:DUF4132 domain-containing protein [Catenulispora rubra]
MSVDPEERFELPRKFQHGVIRRERCDRVDVETISTAAAGTDPQGHATWRSIDLVVAKNGPAAAVRAFAEASAEDVNFSGYSWGRGTFYDSKLADRRWPLMLRLLDLVRSASDEEYAEAIATAETMRDEFKVPAARAAMAVLALDRPEWCSADIADYSADDDHDNYTARLLMLATTSREQARELGRRIQDWVWVNDDRRAEGTFLATIDAGADEFLIGCLEKSRWHALNLLPKLPSELAVNTLIGELGPKDAQAALLEAAKRFPRRVLRRLAEAEPATQVDYVLRLHVAADPERARSELGGLSDVARQRVEALLGIAGAGGGSGAATEAELPRVLVVPPWTDRETSKPVALKGLPVPAPYFCWPSRQSAGRTSIPEPDPSTADPKDQSTIVLTLADWLNSEYEPYSEAADMFFRRYPEQAVRHLLPSALGAAGPERRSAEAAVRFVARHRLADVVALAAESGPEAAVATRAVLDRRGLDVFPKSMPAVPLWADPASLPGILLAGRQAALPTSAVRVVVQMLTISSRREAAPYGGIEIVAEICDRASLAEFAWGLFENWAGAGYPTKKLGWAFDTLLWFGNEETVRRLAPLVRVWPGEGGSARAAGGLDVLIAVGGEEGLREVYDISQRSSFAALRAEAAKRIAKVAAARGLSADQLEDQLVLDLGAGAEGTVTLDYGARRFTVGFDEFVQPYVIDAAGKRRASLPKPTAKDDAELVAEAQQRFSVLRKDAKTLAVRQAARLERAMVTGRRWSDAEFRAVFVEHPLMRLLGRRLVWGEFDGAGALRATFRIAEDGTLADVADERFVFGVGGGDDACAEARTIGLVHPVDLGTELARWTEICHDYEIIQPFPQVGRPVLALTPTEREATRLDRFCGVQLSTDHLLALHRSPGWGSAALWDAGRTVATGRRLPDRRILIVRVSPGYREGRLADTPDQTITDVWLSATDANGRHGARDQALKLGALDAVAASEIVADLTAAVGA